MKRCKKCQRLLQENCFYRYSKKADRFWNVCKECESKRGAEYYAQNREEIQRKRAEYEAKNREKVRERDRIWATKWRAKNIEKSRAYTRASQGKNRQEHPEKVKLATVNSVAKKKNAKGVITEQEWIELRDSFNGICPCCGREIELGIDHIVPISRGGSNTIDNIQPLCNSCNHKKYTKTIQYIQ